MTPEVERHGAEVRDALRGTCWLCHEVPGDVFPLIACGYCARMTCSGCIWCTLNVKGWRCKECLKAKRGET